MNIYVIYIVIIKLENNEDKAIIDLRIRI